MIIAYKYGRKKYTQRQARRAQEAQSIAPADPGQAPTTNNQPTSQNAPSSAIQPVVHQSPQQDVKLCQHQLAQDPSNQSNSSKCEICRREKHDARIYRWKLIVGLLAPYLLASLDLTIVATALPFIASHFDKFNQLNWIVTAYTLTSTAFIPAFGQLADVFGRHSTLQLSMGLQVVGSTLAAASQTWGMLLLGRALQGMSAAGIMNLIQIVLSDKVSLKENAKNNTIFQFCAGVSYSVGPIIGGYLANSNWRYCFVISIPIAIIAHVLIFLLLRKELVRGTYITASGRRGSFWSGLATLDLGGVFFFIFGIGLIILATAWGGSTYSWKSAAVLAPTIIGVLMFAVFWVWEYQLEPGHYLAVKLPRQVSMLPFSLFKKPDMILLAIVEFATGAALYSVFYFIGLYFILVEGYAASRAGVQLLYYVPGIGVGVYGAMFLCNVKPAQTFLPIFLGTLIETIGIAMLTWSVTQRKIAVVDAMMGLAGVGTGLRFMPITLHTAGIWPTRIAPATSVMRFCLPFGGTLALTIMGSVFNNKMGDVFGSPEVAGAGGNGINLHSQQSLDAIKDLPPAVQAMIRDQAKDAVKWAFVSILPILGLALIASLFLGNVWIKGTKSTQANAEKKNETGSSEALNRSYLLALLKGNVEAGRELSVPLTRPEKEEQDVREEHARRNRKHTTSGAEQIAPV